MFQDILTEQTIIVLVGFIVSFLGLGLTAVSVRVAGYFGVKRDNEWLAKESMLRDLLHETLLRAATKAMSKEVTGSVTTRVANAMPSILNQTQNSIPETLTKLKTSVESKAVKDIAETYAIGIAKEMMNIR